MTAFAEVICADERLLLLEERAVYWPARKMLLIADWHLGKAAVFGRRGIAIPEGDMQTDLERLERMMSDFDVDRISILGDLMHAPPAPHDDWPERLSRWLAGKDIAVEVIAGNHDRVDHSSLPVALASRILWYEKWLDVGPFRLCHEPDSHAQRYVIAGHLHPTRRLVTGADRVRAPAFWFRADSAILPAFGSFTGGLNIRPARGERVFIAGPGAVIEVG